jgi:hypothetical protein
MDRYKITQRRSKVWWTRNEDGQWLKRTWACHQHAPSWSVEGDSQIWEGDSFEWQRAFWPSLWVRPIGSFTSESTFSLSLGQLPTNISESYINRDPTHHQKGLSYIDCWIPYKAIKKTEFGSDKTHFECRTHRMTFSMLRVGKNFAGQKSRLHRFENIILIRI